VDVEIVLGDNVESIQISWVTKSGPHHRFNISTGQYGVLGVVATDMGGGFRKIRAPGTVVRYTYDQKGRRHSIQVNDGTPFITPAEKGDAMCSKPPYICVTGAIRINKITLGVDNYPE
jgi:hypothetical protein